MTKEEIEQMFTYHPPQADQVDRYKAIRQAGKATALWIEENVPDSREKSLAFTALQECVMWANAAIAIHDKEKK
jgi:hypothetical protein